MQLSPLCKASVVVVVGKAKVAKGGRDMAVDVEGAGAGAGVKGLALELEVQRHHQLSCDHDEIKSSASQYRTCSAKLI